jgi:hypothetical protein
VQPKRPAHILWTVLIARIYEALRLLCLICGGQTQVRINAFINCSAYIRRFLEYIDAEKEPLRITPARGPPLWDGVDPQGDEGMEPWPNWDEVC